ncbi:MULTISPECIES: type II toxin-antitoxin system PemK/MazF family toxin [Mumia]|uniref:Type II toxin-antitoxin system PemK/MazF family toxin n=2 Tax=Mumia TaxID=1546255 RepID=A0ABW1QHR4_9ACTN|nr:MULTISPECIES: type II toxin-antitoxin system PemK/MazF family toxin [Mumia]
MPRTRDVLSRLVSSLVPTRRPASRAASGSLDMTYDPNPDGRPDPGEIVWTWVPYEDDPRQGKDRPVLIVGRRGASLVAVMLTSKDHDRDAADEARWGRHWLDIGSGGWDRQGRPSEVRLDRLITVDPSAVRREGAVLDRARFDDVVAGVRKHADLG